ncbi:hypothetical protein [Aequorivita sp. KMM 9714]|uniref:hypothetical protein n=1 Tax=Aequorivita sp. KMM 9714 TaxID=2707173 RepID=UPI0013EA447E|nr:hypothetical protein [Aequorivita sp. KMM 9714]NGX84687.1 hypothetical protein [Aequorivita sp. KMM 9714]
MNTVKSLSLITLLGLFTACGVTKTDTNTNTNSNPIEATNRGRANTDVPVKSDRSNKSQQLSTEIPNKELSSKQIEEAAKAKNQKMFVDLAMTEEQVNRFNSEWNRTLQNWNKNNRNKVMNSFERTELQDNILSKILSETQFKNYRVWARENAGSRLD